MKVEKMRLKWSEKTAQPTHIMNQLVTKIAGISTGFKRKIAYRNSKRNVTKLWENRATKSHGESNDGKKNYMHQQ